MRDVTPKPDTLRRAVAEAVLVIPPAAQELLRTGGTEKGDALEISRAAGILAAKRTSEMLPFCHSIPVTHVDVRYAFEDDGVRIEASARTIAPTGVEMEALTAASITALNLYDMLKVHTDDIEIRGVRLVSKKGGEGDYREVLDPPVTAAVIVLSDSVASGRKEDRAGRAVVERLEGNDSVGVPVYGVLPDDPEALRGRVEELVESGTDLVITVGGTGLAGTDRTIEALAPLVDVEVPGIMEAARAHGQRRTPYAMLSRGLAGMIRDTLVITFPGSTRGAVETTEALFPAVLHVFQVRRRIPHRHGYR